MPEKDATKPLVEPTADVTPTAEVPTSTDGAAEEVQEETVAEENSEDEELADRAEFNCPECQGDGLILHVGLNRYERCGKCNGTGKVQ